MSRMYEFWTIKKNEITILLKPGDVLSRFLTSSKSRFSSNWFCRMTVNLFTKSSMYVPKCSIVFKPSWKYLKNEEQKKIWWVHIDIKCDSRQSETELIEKRLQMPALADSKHDFSPWYYGFEFLVFFFLCQVLKD